MVRLATFRLLLKICFLTVKLTLGLLFWLTTKAMDR